MYPKLNSLITPQTPILPVDDNEFLAQQQDLDNLKLKTSDLFSKIKVSPNKQVEFDSFLQNIQIPDITF